MMLLILLKTNSEKSNEFQFWYAILFTFVIIISLVLLLKWQEKQILKNFPMATLLFVFIDFFIPNNDKDS